MLSIRQASAQPATGTELLPNAASTATSSATAESASKVLTKQEQVKAQKKKRLEELNSQISQLKTKLSFQQVEKERAEKQVETLKVAKKEAATKGKEALEKLETTKQAVINETQKQVENLIAVKQEALAKAEQALAKVEADNQEKVVEAEKALASRISELSTLEEQIKSLEQQVTDVRSSDSWLYYLSRGYLGGVPKDAVKV